MLFGGVLRANMASPTYDGSAASAPFINQYVNIVHENIFVTPKSDLTAFYKVEYQVESLKDGVDLPFIFYAMDYSGEFKVWVDGMEVKVDSGINPANKEDFAYAENSSERNRSFNNISIWFMDHEGRIADNKDLKFFKTNLFKGKHLIVVEYNSTVWLDLSSDVKEYSFRYSLTPARSWKSFGTLDLFIDKSDFGEELTCNLEEGLVKNEPSISHYHFDKIPAEFISVTWVPEVNAFASILIFISPFGLMIITFILLVYYHFKWVRKYRRDNLKKRISLAVVLGAVIVPFAAMTSLMFFYPFVDWVIGDQASEYHGYFFLIYILYPIVFPVYWLCMIGVDRYYKERFEIT